MEFVTITPDNIPEAVKWFDFIVLSGFEGDVRLDLSHVVKLNCSYSQITSLPPLPNCELLFCVGNNLTSLPDLPKCKKLYCVANDLRALPELPMCKILHCGRNKLTSLPELPMCKNLHCEANNIHRLPDLPKCKQLNVNNNKLTYIPEMTNYSYIECAKNQIQFVKNKLSAPVINLSHNQICYINEISCEDLYLQYNNLNYISDLDVTEQLVLNQNPLKDYNILQLRQKYPNVEIQFEKEVKVETYKFKYPFDIIFQ